jgi:hypothetical protein
MDIASQTLAPGEAEWRPSEPARRGAWFPDEAVAAVQRHPRFPEALRHAASSGVNLYIGNRFLNLMVNDRGRFFITLLAVHLSRVSCDNDPVPGLTVNRMKRICVEHEICSRGRAEAMIMLMRLYGFLAPAGSAASGSRRFLLPTDRLLTLHRERISGMLGAVAMVLPDVQAALARVNDAEYVKAHVSHVCRQFLDGFSFIDQVPDVRMFFERNAGFVTQMRMQLTADGADTFPPAGIVTGSQSALAREFGVSRIHVRRLLNDAVREGFLERVGAESFRVLPRMRQLTRDWWAAYFLLVAAAARAALAEIAP